MRIWIAFGLLLTVGAAAADLDRDGIDDKLEQQLLERFAPKFQVHREDCDVSPAEFRAGVADPEVVAKNGTIYGRVSPSRTSLAAAAVEIQYFHLWTRDCGALSHVLDIEHVTAFVTATDWKQGARQWKALYWYAAAHEDTLCDNSRGLRATMLDAETRGPEVWVSRGKHASYLQREQCAAGCRADDCSDARPMEIARIVNLGEAEAPLHGAYWVGSPQWKLRAKFRADFDDAALRELQETGTMRQRGLRPVKELARAGSETGGAVGTAKKQTSEKVRNSIRTATEKAGRFLGLR